LIRSQRLENVKQYIYTHKTVTWEELCEEFNVSKNTIRRDVDELVTNGLVKKIYGGVTSEGVGATVSFAERNISNLAEKSKLRRRLLS
jgi:DeoR family myo-inositol catabolism operon transcriptional repressor